MFLYNSYCERLIGLNKKLLLILFKNILIVFQVLNLFLIKFIKILKLFYLLFLIAPSVLDFFL